MKIKILLPLLLFSLFACTTPPQTENLDTEQNQINRLSHPAVIELWTKSEEARKQENYALAESYIEQALSIKPKKGVLWSRLAELAFKQNQPARAENFAARSNAYADGDNTLLKRNWLIIQYSRLKRNDVVGAKQAELTVQKLGY